MPTATLRTIGGSVVMAIPKRLLELVHLLTVRSELLARVVAENSFVVEVIIRE